MNKYIGVRLAGRYEIQEQIGIGGMANVFKARDLIDDITVAVKVLKDEYIQNEEFLRRFHNEAKAIAGLSHPNIVKIYDVIYSDDVPAIVMEYIDGITLKEYIEREGVLKWKEALHYAVQILRALQHAHDNGIVHRDIKPQNIMLLMDGTIKVMDFGIARFARFETKTISGKVVGSVHYISPEQACGDVTDHKTDIYSTGVMLFEMLTGRLPFEADAAVSVAMMQVSKTPARPREINDTIPEGLEEIILKAMQKDTKARYQSAAEMLKDIDEFKKNPSIQFSYKYLTNDDMPTRHFGAVTPEPIHHEEKPQPVSESPEETENEEEEKKSPLVPVLLGVTITVVVGVIIFVILAFAKNLFVKTPSLTVPKVVGMHINDAQREYDEFEFDIVNKEYSDNYAKGVITKQEQKPDTKTKNEVLEVWVSEGPKLERVPDVYDLDINAAKEELKKKGFNNFVEVKEESSEHRLDQVVRTNPERQTEVPLSTKIYIYVAVDKIESVEVPNVVTMSLDDATNLLEKKGFVVAQPIEIPSDKPKGEVLKQDIPGGEWRDEGTEIILTISSGEKAKTSYTLEVKIPESFGDEEVTVKATLEGKSVKEENIYPKDIDYIWKIDIKGTDTQKVVIRINGEEYFKYNVNFEKQTAELTFDKTDTGEENPDEGQEPENNTSSNTESEENQEETTL